MQSAPMPREKPLKECHVGDVVFVRNAVRYVEAFMDDALVLMGTVHPEYEDQNVGEAPRRGPHFLHWTTELAVVLVPQNERPAERKHA